MSRVKMLEIVRMRNVGYGKAFPEMFTGSMMGAGGTVFAVWTYAITNARKTHHVELNPRLLASLIGEPEGAIRDAITYLSSPDPNSRSKEHQGKRIIKTGQFEYFIVNHKHWSDIRTDEERREAKRNLDRENRPSGHKRAQHKEQSDQSDGSPISPPSPAPLALALASASEAVNMYIVNFDKARKLYPGKKRGLTVEFQNFCKHHTDWKSLLDDDGLAECVQVLIARKAYSKGFWPMFQTFCNQNRYEEAIDE